MSLEWGKDGWGPGYRFFQCDYDNGGCGNDWKEKTRDCTSLSFSECPKCNEPWSPIKREMHLEWPVDSSKNLLEE